MNSKENKTFEQNEAIKKFWTSLSGEQRERARACKSIDELMSFAGEEGVELPDELLDAVAGGYVYNTENGLWLVINDLTGEVMQGSERQLDAIICANHLGQRTKEIKRKMLKLLQFGSRRIRREGSSRHTANKSQSTF